MSALLNRVIIAAIRKDFQNLDASFLKPITSYDDKVENDTINFVTLGADPDVLIDNVTYPIAVNSMTDDNIPVALRKLETNNTKITDDELHAIAYDKISAARDKHARALMRAYLKLGAHSLAPQVATSNIPIITTTGATVGHRKKLLPIDLVTLKRPIDNLEVDEEGRFLVLCSDHVNDLLEVDQSFRDRYYNTEKGKLITMINGFGIFETVHTPKYNGTNSTKKAFGAAPAATDVNSSVFYSNVNNMKALGSTKIYKRLAEDDPENRMTVFGARQWSIVHPVTEVGQGAILDTYVP